MKVSTATGKEVHQKVLADLQIRIGSYTYRAWFTVFDVANYDIVLGKQWMVDINLRYAIDYCTNVMWIWDISKKGTVSCRQALHCSVPCVMPNSSQTLRVRLYLLPQFCHAKSALQSLASYNPSLLPHNILAPACFPVHRENCFAMRKSPGASCTRIRCFSHIFQPDTSDFHAQVAYLHSELPLHTLFIYHC